MHNHPHLNKPHQLINDGGIQLKSLLYNIKGHGAGMTPPGTHKLQISLKMFRWHQCLIQNDDIDILLVQKIQRTCRKKEKMWQDGLNGPTDVSGP